MREPPQQIGPPPPPSPPLEPDLLKWIAFHRPVCRRARERHFPKVEVRSSFLPSTRREFLALFLLTKAPAQLRRICEFANA